MTKSRKWLFAFLSIILFFLFAIIASNCIIDPFGVFGDKLLNWYSYNMTQNPRSAKISFLESTDKEYSAFILGASGTSALSPARLNEYTDENWYNLFVYGADMHDTQNFAEYLVAEHNVNHIILCIGLTAAEKYNEAKDDLTKYMHPSTTGEFSIFYYARYLFANPRYAFAKIKRLRLNTILPQEFDVFIPETGVYDKSERDTEFFGDLKSYYEKYPVFNDFYGWNHKLTYANECIEAISSIKSLCNENDIRLTVLLAPLYLPDAAGYMYDEVLYLFENIAEVTEFWDFSLSSISSDPRYFYDATHFRNAVGEMMLARIYNDDRLFIPDDFGVLVTTENAATRAEMFKFSYKFPDFVNEAAVPVLMYHNISAAEANDMTCTSEMFENHLNMLISEGYNTITIDDLIDFVYYNGVLPANPVMLTFDDGYYSNYEFAFPLLQHYNMKATIFSIGISFGKETYKEYNIPIIPHFGEQEALEMVESGVISVYSHSYDMHQTESVDGTGCRKGALPLENESESAYVEIFKNDILQANQIIENATGKKVVAYSYPYGYANNLSEYLLSESGILVTFTTEHGCNTIVRGLGQTLRGMKRITVTGDMSSDDLLKILRSY